MINFFISIPLSIWIAAVGTFGGIIIYLLGIRENRINTKRQRAKELLLEIDEVLDAVEKNKRFPMPDRQLGTATYTAFILTLNKRERKTIETAYTNYKKGDLRLSKFKSFVIKIMSD